MTGGPRQLLLEMLLIKERYSEEDIARVATHLSGGIHDSDLTAISKLANSLRSKPSNKKASERNAPAVDAEATKKLFFSSLSQRPSTASAKRLTSIAKRLRLPSSPNGSLDQSELAEQIKEAINKLSPEELKNFLRSYRIKPKADEGYLGLADYIMHKGSSK